MKTKEPIHDNFDGVIYVPTTTTAITTTTIKNETEWCHQQIKYDSQRNEQKNQ